MSSRITDVLRKRGIPYRSGVLGASLCSFRIGGPVAALIEPVCMGELERAIAACTAEGLPFAVIGRGTNLLIDDGAVDMALIRTTHLDGIRELANGRLLVHCGASLGVLCQRAASLGLSGMEFASGIPGTLGGAVCMNAGAHGKAMSDTVEKVTALDIQSGKIQTLFNHQLSLSYRNSVFQQKNMVLLSAVLRFDALADPAVIQAEMAALSAKRRRTQPLEFPSAGSVFKRPDPAYPLSAELDRLGLKGMRVGGAAVSDKHAGFIVNAGGATAADVRALIQSLQNIVKEKLGFVPIPEIRFIPEEI